MNVTPAAKPSGTVLEKLAGKAVGLAKNVPVIGPVLDTIDSVASSVLSFLGLGSSIAEIHYTSDGTPRFKIRDPRNLVLGTTIPEGGILARYEISIGPSGSRSRLIGSLYQKVVYRSFDVNVYPASSAISDGQIAYVMVTDPLDRSLDTMSAEERKHAILERPTGVKIAQVWQPTRLHYSMGGKEMYVNNADDIERFVCPGVLYIIALTQVDVAKLPTVKVTTSMQFKKATTHSSVHATLSASVWFHGDSTSTSNTVSTLGGDFHELDSWDPTRVTNVTFNSVYASYTAPGILVRAGEFVNFSFSGVWNGSALSGMLDGVYALPAAKFNDSMEFPGSTNDYLQNLVMYATSNNYLKLWEVNLVPKEDVYIVPFYLGSNALPGFDNSTNTTLPCTVIIDTTHNVASTLTYASLFKRHLKEQKDGSVVFQLASPQEKTFTTRSLMGEPNDSVLVTPILRAREPELKVNPGMRR